MKGSMSPRYKDWDERDELDWVKVPPETFPDPHMEPPGIRAGLAGTTFTMVNGPMHESGRPDEAVPV